MAILYTEQQVLQSQTRAEIALYLISESIQNGFYYLYSPIYQTYKTLQYDIYTLHNVIDNENQFITYSSTPTLYEYYFYELVGQLINKVKQFDVFGEFGGAVNPNYQAPGTTITITNPASYLAPMDIPYASFDAATQQPDGGRYIYNNSELLGINPMIQIAAPGLTALFLGIDYELISGGGFQLLPNGNMPFIYDGQIIRATGYKLV